MECRESVEMIVIWPCFVWIETPVAYSFKVVVDRSMWLLRIFLLMARAVPPPRLEILSCLIIE